MGVFAYLKQLFTRTPNSVDTIVASLINMANDLRVYMDNKEDEGADLFEKARVAAAEVNKASKVLTALKGIIG